MQDLCRHAQFVHWLCAIWLRPWRLLLQKRYEQESLGRPLIRMTRCSVHLAQELKPIFEYLRTEVCWSQVVPSAAAVVKQVLFEHWKAGSRWSSECVQIKMETQKKKYSPRFASFENRQICLMQRWRHAQRRQKQKPQRIVGFRDIKERMSNNWSSGLIATGSWNACCTCLAVSQRLHMCFASFWMTGKLVRCRSIVCIARDEEIRTRERVRNYYYGQRGNLLSREMLIWFWWMCCLWLF